jgi:gas vesicle protein
MKKLMYVLLGTVVGGLVGSALAFLFAPASGAESRERLHSYFTNVSEELKQASQQKREELESQLDTLRSGKEL